MRKRIFSLALALVLTPALAAPVFAEEEETASAPEHRLASAAFSDGNVYTFSYSDGGYLPTEILKNGETHAAFVYDGENRMVSSEISGDSCDLVYDRSGDLSEETHIYWEGSVNAPTYWELNIAYTYDGNGNCVTEVTTCTDAPEQLHRPKSDEHKYTYDENGNKLTDDEKIIGSDGLEGSVHSGFTYDEKGNCTGRTEESVYSDGYESASTVGYEYTFDDNGRIASMITYNNGENASTTTYTYDERGRETGRDSETYRCKSYYVPLLDIDWESYPQDNYESLLLSINDNADRTVFYWSLSCAEPEMTYDDNGYLIKAADGVGNYVELTYEPVA